MAVFRDEMMNLFPDGRGRQAAERANTFILSEFLEKKAPHFRLPQLKRKALVQKHCHHEHVMKFDAENAVLKKLGLDYELLDSGCCGMAGSFGFESEPLRRLGRRRRARALARRSRRPTTTR